MLRFKGADARKFLQGQLSNDLGLLAPWTILRAGLHNPQGRTVALLWLAERTDDEIIALLPRELAAPVATQLRKYLLRSRLAIIDESGATPVFGVWTSEPGLALPDSWVLAGDRALLIGTGPAAESAMAPMSREQWRAMDIAAGQPQVYAVTAGQFVAQMLNLDCIEAVSFSKGCYTGQEVIARAHYRGRVKRRMQRFETLVPLPAPLAAGDSAVLEDGRTVRIVEAVTRQDGSSEFLAVAPLNAAVRDEAGVVDAASQTAIRARPLPLPYPLPE